MGEKKKSRSEDQTSLSDVHTVKTDNVVKKKRKKKELLDLSEWDSDSSDDDDGGDDVKVSTNNNIATASRRAKVKQEVSESTLSTTLLESFSGFLSSEDLLDEPPLCTDNEEPPEKPSFKEEREKKHLKGKTVISKWTKLKHANAFLSAVSSKSKNKSKNKKEKNKSLSSAPMNNDDFATFKNYIAKSETNLFRSNSEVDVFSSMSMQDSSKPQEYMAYVDTLQENLKEDDDEQQGKARDVLRAKETGNETEIFSAFQTPHQRQHSLSRERKRRERTLSRSHSQGRKTVSQSCRDLFIQDPNQKEPREEGKTKRDDIPAKETVSLIPVQRRRSLSRGRARKRSKSREKTKKVKSSRDFSSAADQEDAHQKEPNRGKTKTTPIQRRRSLSRERSRQERAQSRSQSRGRKTKARSSRDLSASPGDKNTHQEELKVESELRDKTESDLQAKETGDETDTIAAFQTPKQRQRSLSRERSHQERAQSRSQSRGRKTKARSSRDLSASPGDKNTHQEELKVESELRDKTKSDLRAKEMGDETDIIAAFQTPKQRRRSLSRERSRQERAQSRSQSRGRKTKARSSRDLSASPGDKDTHQEELKVESELRDKTKSDLRAKETGDETDIIAAFQTPKQRRRSLSRERSRQERAQSRSQSRGRKTKALSCHDVSPSTPQKGLERRNRKSSRERVAERRESSCDQNQTTTKRRTRSRERLAAKGEERARSKSTERRPESNTNINVPKRSFSLEGRSRSTSQQKQKKNDGKIQARGSKSKQQAKKNKPFFQSDEGPKSPRVSDSKAPILSPRKVAKSPRSMLRHSAPCKLATELILSSPSVKNRRKIVFSPGGTASTELGDDLSMEGVPGKRSVHKPARAVSKFLQKSSKRKSETSSPRKSRSHLVSTT